MQSDVSPVAQISISDEYNNGVSLGGGGGGETISFPSPHPGVGGMQLLSPDAPEDSQLHKA